ncbi:MAG: 3-phosphoshikimate 1-carboxyvinyltransferase [Kiritimatiellia bacterium]
MVKVIEPGRRTGSVLIPSSKSIAHRQLIAAALSGVEAPTIRGESKDTLATRNCLQAMLAGDPVWPCGESGTTLRLLEPIAGVMGWQGEFRCEGRLGMRPRMPFEKKTRYVVPGNVSSQFVSGLLMALPLADWDSEIVVDGPLQSEAYVRLTEDVLRESGIVFEKSSKSGLTYCIRHGQRYRFPGGGEVEGDWSQAAFFLAMGVEVEGLKADSHQGDRAVVGMLAQLRSQAGGCLDVAQTPDLYPVLAVVNASLGGKTAFSGTERLRLKESDRLASTAALIEAVRAGRPVDTCGDHRIAMSAAVMACFADRAVTVEGAECVAKSYPGFWDDFERLARAD